MTDLETSLQKLGLTPNEISIYIYLLRSGLRLGTEIYTENNLDKSSAYESLSNLAKKNLIYTLGQKRNQQFGAIPAERLLEMIDKQEKDLEQAKANIKILIDDLEEYAKQHYKNKNIRLIEGENGFKQWASARLNIPKGGLIREISSNTVHVNFMKDRKEFDAFSYQMTKDRVAKEIHMKAMMQQRDRDQFKNLQSIEKTDPNLLKEVRLLPDSPEFEIDCSMITFGSNISFIRQYQGEFFGVTITDKLITSLVNNMFDLIWISRPIV